MAIDWDTCVLGPVMGVFGDEVLYRQGSGVAFAIPDAVFDAAYSYVERDQDGIETNTSSPMLGVRMAAFAGRPGSGPAQGDRVYIPGLQGGIFVVKDPRDDSHGHVRLLLNYIGEWDGTPP